MGVLRRHVYPLPLFMRRQLALDLEFHWLLPLLLSNLLSHSLPKLGPAVLVVPVDAVAPRANALRIIARFRVCVMLTQDQSPRTWAEQSQEPLRNVKLVGVSEEVEHGIQMNDGHLPIKHAEGVELSFIEQICRADEVVVWDAVPVAEELVA